MTAMLSLREIAAQRQGVSVDQVKITHTTKYPRGHKAATPPAKKAPAKKAPAKKAAARKKTAPEPKPIAPPRRKNNRLASEANNVEDVTVLGNIKRAWGIAICNPGDGIGGIEEIETPVCLPTVLSADWRCDHDLDLSADERQQHRDNGTKWCECVGDDLVYMGACRCCSWKGPIRTRENEAVEDVNDHCWPGWRDLPVIDPPPGQGSSKAAQEKLRKWLQGLVYAGYPENWVKGGGPIRTRRRGGRHHVATHGFGGYDLCGEDTSGLTTSKH